MIGKNKMKNWTLWLIGVGLAFVVGCKKEPSYEELCRVYYTKLSEKTSVDWKIEDQVENDVDKYLTSKKNERAKLYKEREEDIRRLR